MLVPKNTMGTFIPMQKGNMQLWKKGSQLYVATESGNYFLMQEIPNEYPYKQTKHSKH